jgi:hypothetical protein
MHYISLIIVEIKASDTFIMMHQKNQQYGRYTQSKHPIHVIRDVDCIHINNQHTKLKPISSVFPALLVIIREFIQRLALMTKYFLGVA